MVKVFCTTLARSGYCSDCGLALSTAEYFTAVKGGSKATDVKLEHKGVYIEKSATVTTQYSDIQQHYGSICLFCCAKKEKNRRLMATLSITFGLICSVLAIAALFLFLDEQVPLFAFIILGILAVSLIITARLCYKSISTIGIKDVYALTKGFSDREYLTACEIISALFISYIPIKEIPNGRLALTKGFIKSLK